MRILVGYPMFEGRDALAPVVVRLWMDVGQGGMWSGYAKGRQLFEGVSIQTEE